MSFVSDRLHPAGDELDHSVGNDEGEDDGRPGRYVEPVGEQESADAGQQVDQPREPDDTLELVAEELGNHLRQGEYGDEQHDAHQPNGEDDGRGYEEGHDVVDEPRVDAPGVGKVGVEGGEDDVPELCPGVDDQPGGEGGEDEEGGAGGGWVLDKSCGAGGAPHGVAVGWAVVKA